MWSTAREIAAGDVVIVWMTRDLIQPLTVTPDIVLHNKYGVYPHNTLIGTPYGSRVRSQTGKGFVYVLRPTPELWTLALPHRTQILYLADIAFITEWLGIRKGSRVIEAGTGSASFSHSVARTIGSTGKLYSFEFHEQRAAKAQEEFERHGMSSFVTLQHRNVCKDGFSDVVDEVDAVFLDLPAPWEAIPHAKKALRKDHPARICCFSPCIEQVLRTVTALNEAGFTGITTYETLLRPIEVSISQPMPTLDEVTARLKQAELKREEKRIKQIKANKENDAREKAKAEAKSSLGLSEGSEEAVDGASNSYGKRKHDEVETNEGSSLQPAETQDLEAKRLKTTAEDDSMQVDLESLSTPNPESVAPVPSSSSGPIASTSFNPIFSSSRSSAVRTPIILSSFSSPSPKLISMSKALPEVRGHTSYLTFATLVPYDRYKSESADSSVNPSVAPTPVPQPPVPSSTPGPNGDALEARESSLNEDNGGSN
ncbi:GCD14-domain-containing protein [Coprinopsis marcescibilis]|uniref:tRNA (adenine(58)-N(1))-methyltransferase catalytic subunit TRM61 n=1 Tax=Coprinopsis marcescibilis TaxID=230819 RepID=A0A5C3KS81_COPMA|nr:GCD14-domain-containing protein [Coprinopsis marcescibilis]